MNRPIISVIITVYNGDAFIGRALDSVLAQTLQDWECVVVDDGSTDGTDQVLSSYVDPRIRVMRQANAGRGIALNVGCSSARGEFLAILDADDICDPGRLERQVGFLDSNPDMGLLGSAAELFEESTGVRTIWRYPETHSELRAAMARTNPFCHSSVAMRAAIWKQVGGYSTSLPCCLDYDLYIRMFGAAQAATLPDALVTHTIHAGQFFLGGLQGRIRQKVYTRLMLHAVRQLNLPVGAYLLPSAYYLYARMPEPIPQVVRRYAVKFGLKGSRRSES